jgi:hypothetical protein
MSSDPFNEYENADGDVGLSDEDKKHSKTNRKDWFKGEKNRSYRAALVYFHSVDVKVARAALAKAKASGEKLSREEVQKHAQSALAKRAETLSKAVDQLAPHETLYLEETRFRKFDAHYKEGLGYVNSRLGKDGEEADRVWKGLPEPKRYFATVLLLYPTNNEGDIDKETLTKNWKVMPWRIGSTVYDRIFAINKSLESNDLTIGSQDLKMTCTNSEYQNWTIDPIGKAIWKQNEKFKNNVLLAAYDLYDKLNPFRDMSTADLRIKLGMDSGGSSGEDTSADDVNALLESM